MKPLECLIVGAGMAGLTAAQVLVSHSRSLLVLDKSRGVGGRMATRRLGDSRADHGALCFRKNDEELAFLWKDSIQTLIRPAPAALDSEAWTSTLGMNALAKALAVDVPLELQQTVHELEYDGNAFCCRTKEGQTWTAKKVLMTSPLWQSAEYFKSTKPELYLKLQDLARQVNYASQWTLIIKLAPGVSIEGAAYQKDLHPDIGSVYDQGRKGLPHAEGVWVVQASRAFSIAQLEAEPSLVIAQIKTVLQSLGWNLNEAEVQAHRWRYAFVENPLNQKFVALANDLYLAGDFCRGSTVEAAALSGFAAATDMVRT